MCARAAPCVRACDPLCGTMPIHRRTYPDKIMTPRRLLLNSTMRHRCNASSRSKHNSQYAKMSQTTVAYRSHRGSEGERHGKRQDEREGGKKKELGAISLYPVPNLSENCTATRTGQRVGVLRKSMRISSAPLICAVFDCKAHGRYPCNRFRGIVSEGTAAHLC